MNSNSLSNPAASGTRSDAMLAYAKSELGAFAQFLKRPHRRKQLASSRGEAARRLVLFFLLTVAFDILVYLPLSRVLEFLGGFSEIERSGISFGFSALVLAPVLEELIFRAGLRSAGYCLYAGPVLIAAFFSGYQLCLILAGLVVVIAVIGRLLDKRHTRLHGSGLKFVRGRQFLHLYPLVFWTYAAGFALMHILNFHIEGPLGILVVLAVSSQFFGGICMAYLRLRDGLPSAMALHFLNNAVYLALGALFV